PLAGHPDKEENYHTVTVELKAQGGGTKVSLSQDKNRTEEEMEHSEKNWQMMLEGLKKLLENPY
ncbi:MAG TPA: SRPBCC domain-containing protein, partial [Ignavibacteriaceae bacterium]|nr:SRPBCC domain-containing protein [Ignavibacteriaceae bacterium]